MRVFRSIGTPAFEVPELYDDMREVEALLSKGAGVRCATSAYGQRVLQKAVDFGLLEPPEGTVFLANGGRNSRLSTTRKGEGWTPLNLTCSGLLLSDSLTPIDTPTLLDDPNESVRQQYSTAALYVARHNPEGARPLQKLAIRLNLGRTSLRNVRVFPIADLAQIEDVLHPICRPLTSVAIPS